LSSILKALKKIEKESPGKKPEETPQVFSTRFDPKIVITKRSRRLRKNRLLSTFLAVSLAVTLVIGIGWLYFPGIKATREKPFLASSGKSGKPEPPPTSETVPKTQKPATKDQKNKVPDETTTPEPNRKLLPDKPMLSEKKPVKNTDMVLITKKKPEPEPEPESSAGFPENHGTNPPPAAETGSETDKKNTPSHRLLARRDPAKESEIFKNRPEPVLSPWNSRRDTLKKLSPEKPAASDSTISENEPLPVFPENKTIPEENGTKKKESDTPTLLSVLEKPGIRTKLGSGENGYNRYTEENLPEELEDESLILQALVWSESPGDRMVVINDRILKIGEKINGFLLSRIENDYVIVDEGPNRWLLRFHFEN
jgi:hypothetical protein